VLAIYTYIVSLFLVPYHTREPQMEMNGLTIYFLGWVAAFDDHIFAWFANPLAIFCFIFIRKYPALCVLFSISALLLAHDFYKVGSLGFDSSGDIYKGQVVALGSGSYIWLCSLALIFLASCVQFVGIRQSAGRRLCRRRAGRKQQP